MLHASIRKISKTVSKLQQQLDEMRDRRDEADNRVTL